MGGMRLFGRGLIAGWPDRRRRWPAVLVALLVPTGAVLVGTIGSSGAAPTIAAPILVSSSVSPTTVTAGSPLTFTWQVDSAIGVAGTGLIVNGPHFNTFPGCNGPASLTSGTPQSGTYQEICIVPKYVVNGTWGTIISMQDTTGQSSYSGGPTFTIAGGKGNPPPPVIESSLVSPTTVTAGSAVTITWMVKSKTVVQGTGVSMNGPDFSFLSNCFGNGTLIAGNTKTGTYQQVCVVPKIVANGTWVTDIYVANSLGTEVSVLGPTFTVTGGSKYSPPVVSHMSASPTTVAPGAQMVFTWHVRSRLGVGYTALQTWPPDNSFLFSCYNNGILVAGNARNGTYEEVCSVPASAPTGQWSSSISVQDISNQGIGVPGPSFTVAVPTPAAAPLAASHHAKHGARAAHRARA
jgi:hypothetical protein